MFLRKFLVVFLGVLIVGGVSFYYKFESDKGYFGKENVGKFRWNKKIF